MQPRPAAIQLIPPVPSLFTRFRPYLAHFPPVFSRFLRVFTASPRRFQRAPSRNPGPRNSRQAPTGSLRVRPSAPMGRINWRPRVRDRSIDRVGKTHPSTDCPLMASRVMPTSSCGCNSASEPSLIRLIRGHSSPKIIPAKKKKADCKFLTWKKGSNANNGTKFSFEVPSLPSCGLEEHVSGPSSHATFNIFSKTIKKNGFFL